MEIILSIKNNDQLICEDDFELLSELMMEIDETDDQEVEFDIEAIERELAEKRHYSSTNRWIPAEDIKNGYVVGSKHTRLISDASALDYIVF